MKPRFITTSLTLLVLLGLVGGAGYWGWKQVSKPVPGLGPQQVCTTKTVDTTMTPNQVTVSVYNAGTKGGLAADTMAKLVKRKFNQGGVGDVPKDQPEDVKMVLVRTRTADDPAAQLVAAQFGPDTPIQVSTEVDLGPGIDVVVGNKFLKDRGGKLVPNAETSIPYTTQQTVCSTS